MAAVMAVVMAVAAAVATPAAAAMPAAVAAAAGEYGGDGETEQRAGALSALIGGGRCRLARSLTSEIKSQMPMRCCCCIRASPHGQ